MSGNKERMPEDFPDCPVCNKINFWTIRSLNYKLDGTHLNSDNFLKFHSYPKINKRDYFTKDDLSDVIYILCSKCKTPATKELEKTLIELTIKFLKE